MDNSANRPLSLFYSYSHEDEELRKDLEKHLAVLKREGLIDEWNDRNIEAGTDWQKQLDENLEQADLILILISADFIASDYCYDTEMTRALERHNAGEATVIPIILRSCDWHTTPFNKLQALPRDGKPVDGPDWHTRDEAFYEIATGIRKKIQNYNTTVNHSPNLTGDTATQNEQVGINHDGGKQDGWVAAFLRRILKNHSIKWISILLVIALSYSAIHFVGNKYLGFSLWPVSTVKSKDLLEFINKLDSYKDKPHEYDSLVDENENQKFNFDGIVTRNGTNEEGILFFKPKKTRLFGKFVDNDIPENYSFWITVVGSDKQLTRTVVHEKSTSRPRANFTGILTEVKKNGTLFFDEGIIGSNSVQEHLVEDHLK